MFDSFEMLLKEDVMRRLLLAASTILHLGSALIASAPWSWCSAYFFFRDRSSFLNFFNMTNRQSEFVANLLFKNRSLGVRLRFTFIFA